MSAATLHQAYLHGMKQNGLLTRTGQVRATEFVGRFERTYQPLATVRPFDRIVTPRCVEGMLRLVRKPRSPANPVSHLLLIHFLFGTWDLFNAVVSWEGHMGPPASSEASPIDLPCHNPIGPSAPAHLIGPLLAISQKREAGNISLSKACREEGVDVGTAMRWLAKLGQPVPKRPKKLTDGVLSEARRLLDDGLPLVLIGDQLELSESTIDRICSESPEQMQRWKAANLEWKREKYRQAFLSAIAAEPTITRGQLRKLEGGGFSWLSRHDRAWLTERLPAPYSAVARPRIKRRPRVDWEARDAECARAIAQLAFDFQLQSWERIKPPAILRRLPKLSFSPRLDRLPKSRAAIAEILQHTHRSSD
ncbi:TnsD family Tn7-like transposition protein [Uliginosibacterium sp. H3]|uniref:TnsD family Tn7-like transposition protein n=1 Tax=Uliginosibacterium silvisoli TaxID=3114758 RepID=A0ABU6K6G8_9RHOO|nr:TnsD family Tn7-like transposition protein [Uliginosibacterium sp. H3]